MLNQPGCRRAIGHAFARLLIRLPLKAISFRGFSMRSKTSSLLLGVSIFGIFVLPATGFAQTAFPAPSLFEPPSGDYLAPDDRSSVNPTNEADADPYNLYTGAKLNSSDLPDEPIYACACGCGVFAVGTRSMLPEGTGGMAYLEYDYQDQVTNWNGHTSAPPSYNPDKKIETSWYTPGIQYMFNRSWGIQAEIPIASRYFVTTGGATGTEIVGNRWTTIGDARIWGIYDGFLDDQSLGVTFGLKLPTGDYTHNNAYGDVDRDAEIGTGSTDVLIGGFYRHTLIDRFNLGWFGQAQFDLPFLYRSDTSGTYRNGAEFDGALGVYYTGFKFRDVTITPIAQVITSIRRQDSGSAAAIPVGSGYQRVLLSPGIEFDVHPFAIYADVELPVYQNTNGNQLIGSFLTKLTISYRF
jgi:hypothetical protein